MPFGNTNEEDEDTTFDEVASMADRLGLQGDKRAAYIDDHMRGLGYEAQQSRDTYRRPEKPEDQRGDGGGFGKRWGFGQSQQQQGGGSGGSRRRNEDDSF